MVVPGATWPERPEGVKTTRGIGLEGPCGRKGEGHGPILRLRGRIVQPPAVIRMMAELYGKAGGNVKKSG